MTGSRCGSTAIDHPGTAIDATRGRAQQPRTLRDVVFVEGVRTPFGKAGEKGQYAQTRADDMIVKVIRELLRRNPELPPERIDEVAVAAATQTGDQGLTIGRTAAMLAGLPRSVPGFAIDRMCAGAMTAVTTVASGIVAGGYDVAIAGGVEHMGHHPMGEGADPNPRFVADRLVDPSALNMGNTAENLHDKYPQLTKERADAYSVRQPGQVRRRSRGRATSPPTWFRSRPDRSSRVGAWRPATNWPDPGTTMTALRVSAHAVPSARPGQRGQRLGADRRSHRLPAGRRRGRRRTRPAGSHADGVLRLRRRRAGNHGRRADPGHREGLGQGGSDHRRHRHHRDQRGLRGAGAGLHRPFRPGRRRRPAQSVRRRHRHGPPAGLVRVCA